MDIAPILEILGPAGLGGVATYFGLKRIARGDKAQDTAAKIDHVMQAALLADVQQLKEMAVQVNPLKNLLALKDTRMQSIALMLEDIRDELCDPCLSRSARLIRRIEYHLDQLIPKTDKHKAAFVKHDQNPLDAQMTAFTGIDYAVVRKDEPRPADPRDE